MHRDHEPEHGVRPAGSDTLRPLFAPRSVAVIGASATPGKQGNVAVAYLKRTGFAGRIYPVNPAGGTIEGLACYASIADVPEPVDLVFSIIPASATPAAVEACARAGVGAMIIGAAGFSELGSDAGRRRQAEIVSIARAAGMRILGPNTNGIWNAHHPLSVGFNTSHGEPMPRGPISIAAHSGALFDCFIPRLAAFGGGFSKLVPLGNEADITLLETLAFLIEDPETEVIGLIVEAVADGARLRELAQRARLAGKPIVALKLGRSAAGAGAALAHSSRLAGSARAYGALLDACGIGVVRSIETLAAVTTLLSDKRALGHDGDDKRDWRWIGVSSTGGGCSLMADHAGDLGLAQAGNADGTWGGETARLIAGYEGTGLIRNPVDGGNLHGWDKLPGLIAAMERDGHLGPLVGFAHRLPNLGRDMTLLEPLVARKQRTGAPVVIVAPGGLRPEIEARYAAEHIPVFHDLPTCFESLRCLADMREMASRETGEPALAAGARNGGTGVRSALSALSAGHFLTETASATVLRRGGVPMVESRIVASRAEAQQAAALLGFPVVLKALAPGVAHKNDAGLVAVSLADAAALEAAFGRLERAIAGIGASRDDTAFIVQPMISARAELILGTTWEPALGHFLLAGLGGIDAEAFDSVVLMPVPMTPADIRRSLAASRLAPLLARLSQRTGRAVLAEITAALLALQRVAVEADDMLGSIDINPLVVTDDGLVAVDALIVRR